MDATKFEHLTLEEKHRLELAELINERQADYITLRNLLKRDVYDTKQVQEAFRIRGFRAPFAYAMDNFGASVLLVFQHHPRFYWEFDPNDDFGQLCDLELLFGYKRPTEK